MCCVLQFYVVMIWDDTRKKMVYEISFHSPVLSVRIRKDKYVYVDVKLAYVIYNVSTKFNMYVVHIIFY